KETKEATRTRRRNNLQDFPLGHGMAPYNLLEDMRGKGPDISWPQFLALCPHVRRDLTNAVSPRRKVKERFPVVKIAHAEMNEDITPVLDCYIKGRLVRKGLVDGGAQICIMTEGLMQRLGMHIHETPEIKVKMANNSKARCVGICKNVFVEAFGIKKAVDFYVMSTKGSGYPFILGRPWLMKMRALQDWESGKLICRNDNHKKVVFDMKEQRQEELHEESSQSETEEGWTDSTSEEESSGSITEEESSIEVMGVRFKPTNQETSCQGLEEVGSQENQNVEDEGMLEGMLSTTLTKDERDEFKGVLRKFPKLFAKDYTYVRGLDDVQHKIELKPEAKPKSQKLRRLGVIKEQALLKEVRKILAAGFIYPVENSEWVSPVVVTPKKNGKWRVCVDYRPLNEATKRDHFPLPFHDEILNEVAGHEKYTVCDGYSGYFQIGIALEDQLKTTFITPWGCYAFRVMPFGLTNAPATFQRFMNMVFQAFFGKSIRVFIDDFCIYSSKSLLPVLALCPPKSLLSLISTKKSNG
ncbi:hypothetical protein DD595_24825, partial [Enterobacter cloacae complex sp. 4DZ3-17B2]|uniref:reverse transcriptase family protein n=1 Tax=Enterobacter cloacae complex sp. 4DZ3-17B2 TaxID=2511990 RepID=UPI0010268C67